LSKSNMPIRKRPACCIYCGRPWEPGIVKKSEEHPLGEWMKRQEKNHPPENRVTRLAAEFDEGTNEFAHIGPETRECTTAQLEDA
jgi:hypothetical protein